jgi:hypothetical protein
MTARCRGRDADIDPGVRDLSGLAPATTPPPGPGRHALALAPALILATIVFAPALKLFFGGDDITFLSRAAGLEPTPWSIGRPLSGPVAWGALFALFGLHPLPYHAMRLGLHLTATTLVYAVGFRLLANRPAAAAAAVLFGVSSIAFTPLHSASGIGELLVAAFSLSAFLVFLHARERGNEGLLWAGALLGLAAMLSKEVAVLLPLPLLAVAWRGRSVTGLGRSGGAWRAALPQTILALLFALVFAGSVRGLAYAGGPAYARDFSPSFLALNLATYLRWCVALHVPIRDLVAAVEPEALAAGLAIAAAVVVLLFAQRRAPSHPEEIGSAWFLALAGPVLPLTGHAYLYYLYAPWAGACWLLAGAGQRAASRWPSRAVRVALTLVLIGFAATEFRSVRAREGARAHGLPLDRTVRASLLTGNCVSGLRAAGLGPRDSIAFVSPIPRRHQNVATRDTALHAVATEGASYIPLEGALRGGEVVRLFFPGVRLLGFAESVPAAWEDAALFFYDDDGALTPLGRGLEAQQKLVALMVRVERWDLAVPAFRRIVALGDTSAAAAYGLLVSLARIGRDGDAERLAATFIRRWPDDPRSVELMGILGRGGR